ncbi:putative transposable element [Trichonephila clavipes]|nr:putative transposable element [Trichonephila clavipes]
MKEGLNGVLRPVKEDGRIWVSQGTLNIKKVTHSDGSKYQCIARNSIGERRIESALIVTAPLSVQLRPPYQVLNIGQEATFNCNVTGYPVHTVSWKKDQRQLTPSSRVRLLSRDVLHISSVRREDRGMYQCFVFNDLEGAQGTSELKISANLVALHFKYDQARRRFIEWARNEIAVIPDFHKRILFSDEAHFWLNGYVNKQNCRIWSEANPQVYVEKPLHPEKLTVWCALWAGGIIGPYFFKNDEGHNVTFKGDRYRTLITNFFIPELNNHDVQELWFQQDGATYHTARATIDLLKDTFGDRLISRFGPVNWPPKSCDLTPLDYFMWGYVKSLVYADTPQTLHHLEDNIRRVIADIRPQMLEKVLGNWTSRLDYIRASRGSHMPEIIFKM